METMFGKLVFVLDRVAVGTSRLFFVTLSAMLLLAGPASAVTLVPVTPGGGPYLLFDNARYTYDKPTVTGSASIDDVFTFQYLPPPVLGGQSAVANNALSNIANFTLSWYFDDDSTFSDAGDATPKSLVQGPISQPPGALNFVTLLLDQGPGYYFLELAGNVPANELGQYNLSVQVATPLPGTLPLIAGGLGALWMVGRRRKARKSPAIA